MENRQNGKPPPIPQYYPDYGFPFPPPPPPTPNPDQHLQNGVQPQQGMEGANSAQRNTSWQAGTSYPPPIWNPYEQYSRPSSGSQFALTSQPIIQPQHHDNSLTINQATENSAAPAGSTESTGGNGNPPLQLAVSTSTPYQIPNYFAPPPPPPPPPPPSGSYYNGNSVPPTTTGSFASTPAPPNYPMPPPTPLPSNIAYNSYNPPSTSQFNNLVSKPAPPGYPMNPPKLGQQQHPLVQGQQPPVFPHPTPALNQQRPIWNSAYNGLNLPSTSQSTNNISRPPPPRYPMPSTSNAYYNAGYNPLLRPILYPPPPPPPPARQSATSTPAPPDYPTPLPLPGQGQSTNGYVPFAVPSTSSSYNVLGINNPPPTGTSFMSVSSTETAENAYTRQSHVSYFSGPTERGMMATEVTESETEKHKKAVALYESADVKQRIVAEELSRSINIGPNVSISAVLNEKLIEQYMRGDRDSKILQQLIGSIDIKSEGKTHNFAKYDLTNGYDGTNSGTLPFLCPPPPYPVAEVNRKALDTARDEARSAREEFEESRKRLKKVEKKLTAKEVKRRRANEKTKSERMSSGLRQAYMRYEYGGMRTRGSQAYANSSNDMDIGDYFLKLELEQALSAQKKATENMKLANDKLQAQLLVESSRIAAARRQDPPPPTYSDCCPPSAPVKPPSNRGRGRGRRGSSRGSSSSTSRKSSGKSDMDTSSGVPYQPPSYPSTSRGTSRSQYNQDSQNMEGTSYNPVSDFRSQHPRQTANQQGQSYPNVPPPYGQERPSARQQPNKGHFQAPPYIVPPSQWAQNKVENQPTSSGKNRHSAYSTYRDPHQRQTRSSARLRGFGPNEFPPLPPSAMRSDNSNQARSACASSTSNSQTTLSNELEDLNPTITPLSEEAFDQCLLEMAPSRARQTAQRNNGESAPTAANVMNATAAAAANVRTTANGMSNTAADGLSYAVANGMSYAAANGISYAAAGGIPAAGNGMTATAYGITPSAATTTTTTSAERNSVATTSTITAPSGTIATTTTAVASNESIITTEPYNLEQNITEQQFDSFTSGYVDYLTADSVDECEFEFT